MYSVFFEFELIIIKPFVNGHPPRVDALYVHPASWPSFLSDPEHRNLGITFSSKIYLPIDYGCFFKGVLIGRANLPVSLLTHLRARNVLKRFP
jgi:hypothetical protein